MDYKRLPYEQYFIDTSQNVHGTDTVRNVVKYKSVTFDANHHAEYCVLYDKERDVIQIHFEKTNGKQDWKDNFDFPKQLYDTFEWQGKEIKLYVHDGWGNMYHALKHDMHVDFEKLRKKHPEAKVEVIGWSLGSALAQLCVQDLNYRYGITSYCYTYGSVKPYFFKDKTTRHYIDSCYEECLNFYHRSDIVAYQPPFPGYHMIAAKPFGKYCPIALLDPWKYHTLYNEPEWYEGIA